MFLQISLHVSISCQENFCYDRSFQVISFKQQYTKKKVFLVMSLFCSGLNLLKRECPMQLECVDLILMKLSFYHPKIHPSCILEVVCLSEQFWSQAHASWVSSYSPRWNTQRKSTDHKEWQVENQVVQKTFSDKGSDCTLSIPVQGDRVHYSWCISPWASHLQCTCTFSLHIHFRILHKWPWYWSFHLTIPHCKEQHE